MSFENKWSPFFFFFFFWLSLWLSWPQFVKDFVLKQHYFLCHHQSLIYPQNLPFLKAGQLYFSVFLSSWPSIASGVHSSSWLKNVKDCVIKQHYSLCNHQSLIYLQNLPFYKHEQTSSSFFEPQRWPSGASGVHSSSWPKDVKDCVVK